MKNKKIIIGVIVALIVVGIGLGIGIPQYRHYKTYKQIYDRIAGIENRTSREEAITVFRAGNYITEEQAEELRNK